MNELPVCDRCGLRSVRRELEHRGVILRFCDVCYWGAVEAGDRFLGEHLPVEEPPAAPPPKAG